MNNQEANRGIFIFFLVSNKILNKLFSVSRSQTLENYLIEAFNMPQCFVSIERLTDRQVVQMLRPKKVIPEPCHELNVQTMDHNGIIDRYDGKSQILFFKMFSFHFVFTEHSIHLAITHDHIYAKPFASSSSMQ